MKTRKRSGFTLIETIAAIVVLGIALPPMMWAIRGAHLQRVTPVMASRARWLASEKLEAIIADRHSPSRGYDHLVGGNYPAESSVAGSEAFARAVELVETGPDLATAGSGYMTVTVTVSWVNVDGTTNAMDISTVLTDYTP